MPRLLFSSLPPDIQTPDLAELLSRPPLGVSPPSSLNSRAPRPTDVKVLLTKQGRSRRMAFVGYRAQAEASWVKDVWQGVWVSGTTGHTGGTSVVVEWAKGVEECSAERLRSRFFWVKRIHNASQSTEAPAKRTKFSTSNEKVSNPDLQAFISTMQPRQHKSLVEDILQVTSAQVALVPSPATLRNEVTSQPTTVPDSLASRKKRDVTPDAPPVIGEEDELTEKEYMARRMKRAIGGLENPPVPSASQQVTRKEWDQDEAVGLNVDDSAPSFSLPTHETQFIAELGNTDEDCILKTGRLFLRNLPFSASEEDITALFSPLGELSQVHIPLNQDRKSKGTAYVTFTRPCDALAAFHKLDQHDFQGRLLHVLPAVTRKPRIDDDSGRPGFKNVVKQQKDVKRKLESSKQFNWASLYMNSDAVATSIADRLKISKSELFDGEASNPSVKLALAETHIITETKQFFEQQGIDTTTFTSSNSSRSPTSILVKNIPYGTTASILKGLFEKHGHAEKILMPPCGTIAFVEMGDLEAAKSAFRGLAYKRIGNSVLYLEKAPAGIWKKDRLVTPTTWDLPKTSTFTTTTPTTTVPAEIDEGEPGSTLFIKNISYSTTPETLASSFNSLPDFLFARIQTKPSAKIRGPRQSMGFGFVGFRSIEAAKHALKVMQNFKVDGHVLDVKFAKGGHGAEDEPESKPPLNSDRRSGGAPSSKLLVKNVPFETSKRELRELFSNYGKLESIRLPKKIDRRTRGFGFVEFSTKKEAEKAMRSLKHTHLLGRHLVISYANDNDGHDLEALREKSGGNFLKNKVTLQKTKFQGLEGGDGNDQETLIDI